MSYCLFSPLFCSIFSSWHLFNLRYVCCPPNGGTGWDRLRLPTEDVGSFGSWGCVIFGCQDVWLASYNCNPHLWLHDRNRTFLISWWSFLQGFVVWLDLVFISKHSITWNHKGGEVSEALRYFFFFSRCFRFPMSAGTRHYCNWILWPIVANWLGWPRKICSLLVHVFHLLLYKH